MRIGRCLFPTGCSAGLRDPTFLWGSLWPSGQNVTHAIVNIELEKLSPQEWWKVDCEASKLQIEKKNRFSNKDIVTRGVSQPPLKKSPQLVWNVQLPQKAIRNVKFLEPINNHISHYKCCLCSIIFYVWWCISIKTVDLRLCYYFLPLQYLPCLNNSDHLIIHIGYSYYHKVKQSKVKNKSF